MSLYHEVPHVVPDDETIFDLLLIDIQQWCEWGEVAALLPPLTFPLPEEVA